MSLPALLSAWADYIGDEIANRTPETVNRTVRYHAAPLPDDQCCPGGALGVWWQAIDATIDFPVTLIFKGRLDGASQLVTLNARWSQCWPVPDRNEDGSIIVSDEQDALYDAMAARLALVGSEVTCALFELSCRPTLEVARLLGPCEGFRYIDTRPDISGGCAGIRWRAYAAIDCEPPTT